MATYVFSDVHGHYKPLVRLFDRVSPSADDQIFMLGDMIDRGPDSVEVLKFCRDLNEHGATVLMGNHEDLMNTYLFYDSDEYDRMNWQMNGGETTYDALSKMRSEERFDLLDWSRRLPLASYVRIREADEDQGLQVEVAGEVSARDADETPELVLTKPEPKHAAPAPAHAAPEPDEAQDQDDQPKHGDKDVQDAQDVQDAGSTMELDIPTGSDSQDDEDEQGTTILSIPQAAPRERLYLFSHAGINPERALHFDEWTDDNIKAFFAAQSEEDLVWVRDAFWSRPTGLIGPDGRGPIVVSGHTPTVYLTGMADLPDRPGRRSDGLCQMVKVGAGPATGGVADRWDIDAGAAGGAGFGQVLLLRLDDGMEFYEPIGEGE